MRADDQGRPRRHRPHLGQPRVRAVGVGELGVGERDRPVDGHRLVGQVEERVRVLRRGAPVVVDQVGVGRRVLEGLERVAHPARHEHGPVGTDLQRHGHAERRPGPQVDPGPEHPAAGHGDVLVPGLGVDAARHAGGGVEGDVVLHRPEVGQAVGDHLGPLPVLLEPAAVVAAHGELDDQQPGDLGRLDAARRGAGSLTGLTGPAPRTGPRSAPSAGATTPRSRGTSRSSRRGPR